MGELVFWLLMLIFVTLATDILGLGIFGIWLKEIVTYLPLAVVGLLIVLIGALPLGVAPLSDFTNWIMAVPVDAGARGILLGISLATAVTGLRILVGQDRSYGE